MLKQFISEGEQFIELTDRLSEAIGEVKDLEQLLHSHLPAAKSQYLKQWLEVPALPVENRLDLMRTTQMTVAFHEIFVILFRLHKSDESLNYNRMDRHLLSIAASNIIQETLESLLQRPVELVSEHRSAFVICNGAVEQLRDRLQEALAQVQANLHQYLRISVSIGISRSKPDMNQLHIAYEEAIEALMNPQRMPKRKVQQALEYIETSYAEHGLTLASVAKALFVSSTYLSTLFKQEVGVNFLDYVHQHRIEKAKALLQASDLKIHSVAKEVGYYDEAHFTKTFKKWTGMLPSRYKKEAATLG